MRRATTILAVLSFCCAHSMNAQDVSLRISVPQSIVDGSAARVTVSVENATSQPLRVPEPTPNWNIQLTVTPKHVVAPVRCFSRTFVHADFPQPVANNVELKSGETYAIGFDLFEEFPLGLSPGKYEIKAKYAIEGRYSQAAATFAVVTPGEELLARYSAFTKLCRTIEDRDVGTPTLERMLSDFTDANRTFYFTAPLLEYAIKRRPETTVAARLKLLEYYPGSQQAQVLAQEIADAESTAKARRKEFELTREEYRKVLSSGRTGVKQGIRTFYPILTPENALEASQFIRIGGDSMASRVVTHALLLAAQRGVVAPGKAPESEGIRLQRILEEEHGNSAEANLFRIDSQLAEVLKSHFKTAE